MSTIAGAAIICVVVGNGCAPLALFPNMTYAAPRAAFKILARDEVNVMVCVVAAAATVEVGVTETSLMTPMMVVVAGNVEVAPLAVTVCVNVPPIEGIVVTMIDAVTSVLAATVPEPPSEKVIVCAAELYTAPRIVTVPQPETASTVGFVAMPEP